MTKRNTKKGKRIYENKNRAKNGRKKGKSEREKQELTQQQNK